MNSVKESMRKDKPNGKNGERNTYLQKSVRYAEAKCISEKESTVNFLAVVIIRTVRESGKSNLMGIIVKQNNPLQKNVQNAEVKCISGKVSTVSSWDAVIIRNVKERERFDIELIYNVSEW